MKQAVQLLRKWIKSARATAGHLWKGFRALKRWIQIVIVIVAAAIIFGLITLLQGGSADTTADSNRTVTLANISELSGTNIGVGILGNVRSVTQADVIAQAGGVVQTVNTHVGATVPAGFVLASLENSSQSAVLLQAQGAYDAAVAARSATVLQSGNSATSLAESATAARNLYQSAYTTTDSTLHVYVDVFFGAATPSGPALTISPNGSGTQLSRERADASDLMDSWSTSISNSAGTDPAVLLNTAEANLQKISAFLSDLAQAASAQKSGATASQLASLATARASVQGLLSSVSSTRDAYNAKKTAAAVGATQADSTSNETASADASVKQALGNLRGAQAAYEKTVLRTPIAGTVNVLNIHVGDFVAPSSNIGTIARNNALEIVAYMPNEDRNLVAVGDTVRVEDSYKGIVTLVAPALDPVTKQIELHVAVADGTSLVDGESVHITLPNLLQANAAPAPVASSTTSATVSLPLASVKLRATDRVVFTVEQNILVAHAVTIGDVVGDHIEVTSGLTPDMRIVTDARGLSEGQRVLVATTTP